MISAICAISSAYDGNPCVRANIFLAGRVEDFHLNVFALCWAHHKKSGLMKGRFCCDRNQFVA